MQTSLLSSLLRSRNCGRELFMLKTELLERNRAVLGIVHCTLDWDRTLSFNITVVVDLCLRGVCETYDIAETPWKVAMVTLRKLLPCESSWLWSQSISKDVLTFIESAAIEKQLKSSMDVSNAQTNKIWKAFFTQFQVRNKITSQRTQFIEIISTNINAECRLKSLQEVQAETNSINEKFNFLSFSLKSQSSCEIF